MNIAYSIKKTLKENKGLLFLIVFVFLAVLFAHSRSYNEGYYFVTGGDVRTQWYQFYTINRRETINALRGGIFPFYSWITFLGTNIWAAHASYGLFDVFNIATYPLNLDYYVIYDIQCYAKLLIGSVSFYLLIKEIYKNDRVSSIAGICYGLSSFALYFQSQPGFLSFFALMPLYFLGMEKYLQKNKKILFTISVFLLLLTNYYLFFSVSMFSPIYFIYRYYNIHGELKGFILKALKLIGHYLVGVMMSAIVIIPAFFYITQSERVGNFAGSFVFDDLNMYIHLLINSFLPSHTYIYGVDIFNRTEHTLKEICMYAGSVIPIINMQILKEKNNKFRNSTIILYVILIAILFVPYGNTIMQGFSEVCFRWVILIVMMNLIVASHYLSDISKIDKKTLVISTSASIFMIVVLYFLAIYHKNGTPMQYAAQIATLFQVVCFILLDVFLILKENKKFLTVALLIELMLFAYKGNYNYSFGGTEEDYKAVRKVLANDIDYHELQYYLNSLDVDNANQYYRTYIPYESLYWSYSRNMNIIYDLKGLMSYSSTTAPSFNDMKYINYDEIVGIIDWEYDIQDPNLLNFYATKYSITVTEEEIPFENYEIVAPDYRGGLIVSKNLDYDSLGRTYSKTMTVEEFESLNKDTSLLMDYIITDEFYMNVDSDSEPLTSISYFGNQLSGYCQSDSDQLMLISLPYDSGWKILVNGNEVDYFKVNGGNICFEIPSGDVNIEMYFVPQGFKVGAIVSAFGLVVFVALSSIEIKNHFNKKAKD